MHRRKTSFAEAVRWMTPPQQSSFVVAGAHSFGLDNELNDLQHLVQLARQRPWAALLLIEASPLLASQLEATIRAQNPFRRATRIIVSNAAICPKRLLGQSLPFFTVAAKLQTGDPRLPGWADQFGTFERTRIDKLVHDIPRFMDKNYGARNNWTLEAVRRTVVSHEVPCRSIADEVRQRKLPPPAVVLIDIEGLDCEVASELSCETAPSVLQFETSWCPKAIQDEAIRRMPVRTACSGETLGYSNATRPKWSDVAFYRRARPDSD